MSDAIWAGIMGAAIIAVGIGLDRLSKRYAENHLRLAEEVPAFKDETAPLPLVGCEATADSATIKVEPKPEVAPKVCPICKHRNKSLGCKALIRTKGGTALKCRCVFEFHNGPRRKRKRSS